MVLNMYKKSLEGRFQRCSTSTTYLFVFGIKCLFLNYDKNIKQQTRRVDDTWPYYCQII